VSAPGGKVYWWRTTKSFFSHSRNWRPFLVVNHYASCPGVAALPCSPSLRHWLAFIWQQTASIDVGHRPIDRITHNPDPLHALVPL